MAKKKGFLEKVEDVLDPNHRLHGDSESDLSDEPKDPIQQKAKDDIKDHAKFDKFKKGDLNSGN